MVTTAAVERAEPRREVMRKTQGLNLFRSGLACQ
jgi:hypothetical protein